MRYVKKGEIEEKNGINETNDFEWSSNGDTFAMTFFYQLPIFFFGKREIMRLYNNVATDMK